MAVSSVYFNLLSCLVMSVEVCTFVLSCEEIPVSPGDLCDGVGEGTLMIVSQL